MASLICNEAVPELQYFAALSSEIDLLSQRRVFAMWLVWSGLNACTAQQVFLLL